jgi:hypothetical protein
MKKPSFISTSSDMRLIHTDEGELNAYRICRVEARWVTSYYGYRATGMTLKEAAQECFRLYRGETQ